MAHIQDEAFASLGLQKSTSLDGVVSYHTSFSSISTDRPILVLLHGYPNSAYLWRHMIPKLPGQPLFVPDLPGYGNSTPAKSHDKVSVGLLVLSALREVLALNSSDSVDVKSVPVVLIGHDRGARIAHHLHLAHANGPIHGFKIIGLALLDIVPTLSQWAIGDTAASTTGMFHWAFLANASLAIPMINAYGGGKWACNMIKRWSGSNVTGLENIKAGDAEAVYGAFFDRDSVVEATTRDYEAGATVDLEFEEEAIEQGRVIVVPLLLVYSAEFLPKRAKKPILEVWSQPWSEGPHLITECPIAGGVGHFVPEEAPMMTAEALSEWLKTL